MYYSVTQVCRCNEETRTNSSETSLTGQPLYDTSTNELYIGDGETTIQNLSPIQNLKAGTGMTYTNGSVSLNEGTQTNAGGIKVWAENNDVYYSTPNGEGAVQLFPMIRTYHPGYNQSHPNYHTLSGTASTQYDTGGRTPHNDDISITLNYKGITGGSGIETGYAIGSIHCDTPEYDNYTGTTSSSSNSYIDANTNDTFSVYVSFPEFTDYRDLEYVSSRFIIYGNPSGYLSAETSYGGFSIGGTPKMHVLLRIYITINNTTGSAYSFSWSLSCIIKGPNGKYTGSDTYGVAGRENVVISGDPDYHTDKGTVSSINSKYNSSGQYIITTATVDIEGANVSYNTPFTYTPDGYLYEGTETKDIGDDAENVNVYPETPDDTTAFVEYSGSTATITANCVSPTNVGSSIDRNVTLSYNTPIYGYYTNINTYIGSDYGARVTSTSSSVINYSSDTISNTNGNYFWVNMRAASQTSVRATAVSYWDSWVSEYNSYHYPIELNGVRHNFNTIDLDGVNYTATAEKYNKR